MCCTYLVPCLALLFSHFPWQLQNLLSVFVVPLPIRTSLFSVYPWQKMFMFVVASGCQAGNQNYIVQYQATRTRCVNGRGAIHPVTNQRAVKMKRWKLLRVALASSKVVFMKSAEVTYPLGVCVSVCGRVGCVRGVVCCLLINIYCVIQLEVTMVHSVTTEWSCTRNLRPDILGSSLFHDAFQKYVEYF